MPQTPLRDGFGTHAKAAAVVSTFLHVLVIASVCEYSHPVNGKAQTNLRSAQPAITVFLVPTRNRSEVDLHNNSETHTLRQTGDGRSIAATDRDRTVFEPPTSINIANILPPAPSPVQNGITYYPQEDLDEKATLTRPPYDMLPDNDQSNVIGSVRMRILISDTGEIDDVVIEENTLPAEYVEKIRTAWLRSAYAPGKIDSAPVRSQVIIELHLTNQSWQPRR